jgi:nudix-type nucleoside diphosphatase (YffH/AdpP family)
MTQDRTTRILKTDVVFEGWYRFLRMDVELPDGARVERELLANGSAVAVLPYDRERRVVMLIRQPRPGAFYTGEPSPLEAIAGSLDGMEPALRIVEEAMEEGGLKLGTLEPVSNIWSMVPAATERVQLYLSEYAVSDRVGEGGGAAGEFENIKVFEIGLDKLRAMVAAGDLTDSKTLILAQALLLRHPELWDCP